MFYFLFLFVSCQSGVVDEKRIQVGANDIRHLREQYCVTNELSSSEEIIITQHTLFFLIENPKPVFYEVSHGNFNFD